MRTAGFRLQAHAHRARGIARLRCIELTRYLSHPASKVCKDVVRMTTRVLAHEAADRMREAFETCGGDLH